MVTTMTMLLNKILGEDKSCVFINKLAKAASRGDRHCVSVTLSFGSEFLLCVRASEDGVDCYMNFHLSTLASSYCFGSSQPASVINTFSTY